MKTDALDKAIQEQKNLLDGIQKMQVLGHPRDDVLLKCKENLIESLCDNIHYLIRIRDTAVYGK
jgi:hypothetical protein